MAEALMKHWGKGRFHAYSAGSYPKGEVHPLAVATLERQGLPTLGLRSKSWDEFAAPQGPRIDFVFTVCDNAAGEVCPIWPGQPMTAHWGIADPAAATGTEDERRRAFQVAFRELDARIKVFANLQIESIERMALQRRLDAIGKVQESATVIASEDK